MKSQEEQWLLAEKYDGVKSEAFYADCKALALGTPLGYLIGHVPFLSCTIHLDEQPLIPRVETEYWVERAITEIKLSTAANPSLFQGESQSAIAEVPQRQSPPRGLASQWLIDSRPATRILDLCAGSGCIGVAVAKDIPDSLVDFGELSQRLLPTITKNCIKNNIDPQRYHIYHSNLFQNIPTDNKYDFILSNPPYIDPSVDRATDSVKSHEPHLALYGGIGGMEIIEQLLATATKHLTPTGQLWIEHEPEQASTLAVLASQYGFGCTSHLDQYQVTRYSILVLE